MYTCSGISWKSFLETREMEKALLSVRSSLAKNRLEFRPASRMMASPRRKTTISARFFIGPPPSPFLQAPGLPVEVQEQGADQHVEQKVAGVDQALLEVVEMRAQGQVAEDPGQQDRQAEHQIDLGDQGEHQQHEQADQEGAA